MHLRFYVIDRLVTSAHGIPEPPSVPWKNARTAYAIAAYSCTTKRRLERFARPAAAQKHLSSQISVGVKTGIIAA